MRELTGFGRYVFVGGRWYERPRWGQGLAPGSATAVAAAARQAAAARLLLKAVCRCGAVIGDAVLSLLAPVLLAYVVLPGYAAAVLVCAAAAVAAALAVLAAGVTVVAITFGPPLLAALAFAGAVAVTRLAGRLVTSRRRACGAAARRTG